MANSAFLNFIENTLIKISSADKEIDTRNEVIKEKNINNVFGFWSPFDGVGKSTALINIAYELTKLDNTVCVVDLNLVCPDLFRYVKPDLGLNKQENSKSIKDKILNKSIPITEYIMKTKVNNLSLLTSVFLEHPSIYCESMLSESQQNNTIDTYISIFEELAVLFDYVIIDLDSNMLDISTISAFKSCDRIYTFLGHQIKSLEYLIKTTKVFDEIGMVDLFNNIIQGPIINEQWSENELRKYNKNINIIANFPFCQRVHAVGNNLEIFTAVDNSISKSAIEYKKSIKRIIAHIQEHRINENVQEIEYMQMIEGLEEIHIEETEQPITLNESDIFEDEEFEVFEVEETFEENEYNAVFNEIDRED
jgi:MinD-like ATPase involved in chromosome partitioning or flagellar assembly